MTSFSGIPAGISAGVSQSRSGDTDTVSQPAREHVQARILALVGMPGSGKSLLAEHLQSLGYPKIRFGQITIDEVIARGLEVNPRNEKLVRDDIRHQEGMDAYARRSLPHIHKALDQHNSLVIDGLYSFSEYKTLKREFGDALVVVAVVAERRQRYARLGGRDERPLTQAEAEWRDIQEIETLEKGGPIAMADYTILNTATPEASLAELDRILSELNLNP